MNAASSNIIRLAPIPRKPNHTSTQAIQQPTQQAAHTQQPRDKQAESQRMLQATLEARKFVERKAVAETAYFLLHNTTVPFFLTKCLWPNTHGREPSLDKFTNTPLSMGQRTFDAVHRCRGCSFSYACQEQEGRHCVAARIETVPTFWCSERCRANTLARYPTLQCTPHRQCQLRSQQE